MKKKGTAAAGYIYLTTPPFGHPSAEGNFHPTPYGQRGFGLEKNEKRKVKNQEKRYRSGGIYLFNHPTLRAPLHRGEFTGAHAGAHLWLLCGRL